jgi:hypothetical protein
VASPRDTPNHFSALHDNAQRLPLHGKETCSHWPVGAAERSEAAIFPLPIESGAKDQKIAGFASSYRPSALAVGDSVDGKENPSEERCTGTRLHVKQGISSKIMGPLPLE